MKRFTGFCRKVMTFTVMVGILLTLVGAVSAQIYDPAQEGIVSSYYQVQNGMIRGIAPGTAADKLAKVCLPEGVVPQTERLFTGLQLTAGQAALTVVVTGDLNGDGQASITDLLMVKTHLLGQALPDVAAAAGDVNYDGKVTITDFLRIKSNLLGMEGISAGQTAGYQPQIPLMLLVPGQTGAWQKGAASYLSANEAVATVDAAGTVTAQGTEGSTLVYALDDQGQAVDRVLVTVLQEALCVSLGQTSHRLATGASVKLNAQLNHPVSVQLQWTSSDASVATVDATGNVTAVKPGEAVITASLPNGSKADVKITVAPPITAMNIERVMYKVKPGAQKQLALQVTPTGENEVFIWTSSDPNVATVNENGVVTGVAYGTVTVTVTGKYSGLKASCQVKVCDVKQVAMTFDDGPSKQTARLLDFLKENDLRVTFFVVGNRMGSFPDMIKREAAEGHEMGFHSYAHKQQTSLSSAQIKSDFDKSNQYLKELTGREFTVWRTPGGGYNDRVLQALPLPHILWSVDTNDWRSLNAASVRSSILNNAKDGSIVLMHDLYGSTVDGAISAMQQMMAGDYEFVTVTELLSRNGTPPAPSVTYHRG